MGGEPGGGDGEDDAEGADLQEPPEEALELLPLRRRRQGGDGRAPAAAQDPGLVGVAVERRAAAAEMVDERYEPERLRAVDGRRRIADRDEQERVDAAALGEVLRRGAPVRLRVVVAARGDEELEGRGAGVVAQRLGVVAALDERDRHEDADDERARQRRVDEGEARADPEARAAHPTKR